MNMLLWLVNPKTVVLDSCWSFKGLHLHFFVISSLNSLIPTEYLDYITQISFFKNKINFELKWRADISTAFVHRKYSSVVYSLPISLELC